VGGARLGVTAVSRHEESLVFTLGKGHFIRAI
jgi:hypothetical protein